MAEALTLDVAIERFGIDPNRECTCGHVLISHMPNVYECRAQVVTLRARFGDGPVELLQTRPCGCEQFTPASL